MACEAPAFRETARRHRPALDRAIPYSRAFVVDIGALQYWIPACAGMTAHNGATPCVQTASARVQRHHHPSQVQFAIAVEKPTEVTVDGRQEVFPR
jgi:hypothetical protein